MNLRTWFQNKPMLGCILLQCGIDILRTFQTLVLNNESRLSATWTVVASASPIASALQSGRTRRGH